MPSDDPTLLLELIRLLSSPPDEYVVWYDTLLDGGQLFVSSPNPAGTVGTSLGFPLAAVAAANAAAAVDELLLFLKKKKEERKNHSILYSVESISGVNGKW